MRHRFRPSQQHLLAAPGSSVPPAEPADSGKPAPPRGKGRPAALAFAAAAAAVATAAVAAGVVIGPTAPATAVAWHIRAARDVTSGYVASHHGGGPFLGGTAVTERALGAPAAWVHRTGQRGTDARADSPAKPRTSAGAARSGGSQSAAAGQRSPSPSASAPPPAEVPITIYDSVQPASIPPGVMAATYATGKFAVPPATMAGRPTIWIDTWATDPAASVLDVEPGDATPGMAATWVAQKLTADPTARARIYTMLGEWASVRTAMAALPTWMQAQVRYWIADPTGVPHMVAGANATQWYWGSSYDISTANPGF